MLPTHPVVAIVRSFSERAARIHSHPLLLPLQLMAVVLPPLPLVLTVQLGIQTSAHSPARFTERHEF